jgi:hypothetical protein
MLTACLQRTHSKRSVYMYADPARAFQLKSRNARSYTLGSTFEFKIGRLRGLSPRCIA